MLIERKPERAEQIIANRLDQLQAAIETTLAGLRALAEGST
jgi:prefoldin subunit 5